jgi:hypothetical protein
MHSFAIVLNGSFFRPEKLKPILTSLPPIKAVPFCEKKHVSDKCGEKTPRAKEKTQLK